MPTPQQDLDTAQACLRNGDFKSALRIAKTMMRALPKSPIPLNLAGIAASGMGKPVDGIAYFKKTLKIAPDFHDARKNAAQTLLSMGKPDQALTWLSKLVTASPTDPVMWYLYAQALMGTQETAKAHDAIQHLIDLQPDQVRGYHLRATLHLQTGLTRDALSDFEAMLEIDPNNTVALTEMSLPLARQLRTQEALNAVEKAVALQPNLVSARLRLGNQLVEMGNLEAARLHYAVALEQEPNDAYVIERFAEVATPDTVPQLERAAQAALKSAPKRSEDRAALHFGLSRLCAASKDPEQSMKHLQLANKTMASLLPYNAAQDRTGAEKILARFTAPSKRNTARSCGVTPVFIVGLPRSGTTLAEVILGAHPNVVALGEQGNVGAALAPLINQDLPFDDVAIDAFHMQYARQLPDLPDGTTAYVDKMPENYRLIGFIKTAFPDCRIIHMKRDPRAVALSMWKAHFSGSALAYTYDFKSMAQRFNIYAQMMAHWSTIYSDEILTIHYESMTQDVEATSKTIAAFCDLEWTPQMARPDLAADQVLTASATQVRQPVHTRSVAAWRAHETLLAPFIAGLDSAFWPLD